MHGPKIILPNFDDYNCYISSGDSSLDSKDRHPDRGNENYYTTGMIHRSYERSVISPPEENPQNVEETENAENWARERDNEPLSDDNSNENIGEKSTPRKNPKRVSRKNVNYKALHNKGISGSTVTPKPKRQKVGTKSQNSKVIGEGSSAQFGNPNPTDKNLQLDVSGDTDDDIQGRESGLEGLNFENNGSFIDDNYFALNNEKEKVATKYRINCDYCRDNTCERCVKVIGQLKRAIKLTNQEAIQAQRDMAKAMIDVQRITNADKIENLNGRESAYEIKNFFKKLEIAVTGMEDRGIVDLLHNKLEGRAQDKLEEAIDRFGYSNYRNIKGYLIDSLSNIDIRRMNASDTLRRGVVRKEKESLANFGYRVLEMTKTAHPGSHFIEEEAAKYFLNSLNDRELSVQLAGFINKNCSFDEILEKAVVINNSRRYYSDPAPHQGGKTGNYFNQTSNYSNQRGNYFYQNRNQNQKQNFFQNNSQNNNFANNRNFPQNSPQNHRNWNQQRNSNYQQPAQQQNQQNYQNGNGNQNQNGQPLYCYTCGEEGHKSPQCPNKQQNQQQGNYQRQSQQQHGPPQNGQRPQAFQNNGQWPRNQQNQNRQRTNNITYSQQQ